MRPLWKGLVLFAVLLAAGSILWSAILAKKSRQQDTDISGSRQNVTLVFCGRINNQSEALRGLILRGAKDSRIFEPLYQQFHAPPFRTRLQQAQKDASLLAPLDCRQLLLDVQQSAPPP